MIWWPWECEEASFIGDIIRDIIGPIICSLLLLTSSPDLGTRESFNAEQVTASPTVATFHALDGSPVAGKIESMGDANGNTLHFDYDNLGRLTTIRDTLGRSNVLAYNAAGEIASVRDFSGRQVGYTYYAAGEPGGNEGDLKSVTSQTVTGTPNGNDFPLGKTTTYTYSKGLAHPDLNHNLLTITDPRGITVLSNHYADTSDPAVWTFDVLVVASAPDPANPSQQQHHMISYVPQTPTPSNRFAAVKAIVNDPIGNVSEHVFDSQNRQLSQRAFTGRVVPNLFTTETQNRPTSKLRSTDPDSFETSYEWNGDSQLARVTYPNSNRVDFVYEADVDPDAKRLSRQNLRLVRRLPGPLGGDQAQLVERFDYTPTFLFPGSSNHWADCLTRSVDARGFVTRHTYNASGNRTRTRYPIAGVERNWEYNEFGQVTAVVHPADVNGHRRRDQFVYSNSGPSNGYPSTATVDFGGQALTYVYSVNIVGLVERIVDPQGNDTRFNYNQLDQLVSIQSPVINTPNGPVRFEKLSWFDAGDNLVRVDVENRGGDGSLGTNSHFTTIYEYDALSNLKRVVGEKGNVNLANTVVTLADIPGAVTSEFMSCEWQNDFRGNPTLVRSGEAVNGNQPNNVVQILYDERDLPYRVIRAPGDPNQSTTQFDYDGNKNLARTARGIENTPRITQRVHDGFNRRVSTTDAMGNVAQFVYDANGNTVTSRVMGELTDTVGSSNNVRLAETAFTYDAMNRRTRADRAFFNPANQSPIGDGAATTLWAYATNSTLLSETDDRGFTTAYAYDTAYRLRQVTDAEGNYRTFTYDSNSLVTVIEDVDKSDLGAADQLFVTRLARDPLGRVIQTMDSASNIWQSAWNSRGLCVVALDARSNVTHYAYDGLGRHISTSREMTSDGTGSGNLIGTIRTTQTWNDNWRLIASADGKSNVTRHAYDVLNRRIVTQHADGTTHQVGNGVDWVLGQEKPDLTGFVNGYDVRDNVVTTRDANGSVVTAQHDLNDRLTSRSIVPGNGVASTTTMENYTYDGLSRLVRAQDDNSDALFTYDSLSNPMSETLNGQTTTRTYDGVGNDLSISYPGGLTVVNAFSSLSDLSAVTANSQPVANFSHVGRRVERIDFGNGVRGDFSYDGISGVQNPSGDLGVANVARATVTRLSDTETLSDWSFKHEATGSTVGTENFWWFDWDWFSPSRINTGAEPWNFTGAPEQYAILP